MAKTKITDPGIPSEVYEVLGIQPLENNLFDVGFVCSNAHGRTNPMAKYKPVPNTMLDYPGQMNAAKTGWLASSSWWRGYNGNCGLDIRTFENMGDMKDAASFFSLLSAGSLPWSYVPPVGSAGQPFRINDFLGYNHLAQAPIGPIASNEIWLSTSREGQIDFEGRVSLEDELSLDDIYVGGMPIPGNFYLGVLFWQSNAVWYLTSESPVAKGQSVTIPFTAPESLTGVWNAVPFLSSRRYTLDSQSQMAGVYASLFGIKKTQMTIHAPGTTVTFAISAYWNATKTGVNYTVNIRNNGTTPMTVRNVGLEIKYLTSAGGNPAGGSATAPGTVKIADSVTVQGGSQTDLTGSVDFSPNKATNPGYEFFVRGYADGLQGSGYYQIEEEYA